jgi:hypothetical protein
MTKYKILVIAHCLKHKKIAKYGEIVDESQLTSSAFDLVEQGFIKLVSKKETVVEPVKVLETEEIEVDEEVEDEIEVEEAPITAKYKIKQQLKNK